MNPLPIAPHSLDPSRAPPRFPVDKTPGPYNYYSRKVAGAAFRPNSTAVFPDGSKPTDITADARRPFVMEGAHYFDPRQGIDASVLPFTPEEQLLFYQELDSDVDLDKLTMAYREGLRYSHPVDFVAQYRWPLGNRRRCRIRSSAGRDVRFAGRFQREYHLEQGV
ncbi:hypothetical protein AAF712_011971 [Marasmius tenuissimus]|uniref:Uncharacterized protein n=1 Tax=Marasmius tenuissimus TaxID=585030 RepID=A0ABR2ZL83_9AGAR